MVSCARRKSLTSVWSEWRRRSSSLRHAKVRFSRCTCVESRHTRVYPSGEALLAGGFRRKADRVGPYLQSIDVDLANDTVQVEAVDGTKVQTAPVVAKSRNTRVGGIVYRNETHTWPRRSAAFIGDCVRHG